MRKMRDLTQPEVAEQSFIGLHTYRNFEAGRKTLDVIQLEALAKKMAGEAFGSFGL